MAGGRRRNQNANQDAAIQGRNIGVRILGSMNDNKHASVGPRGQQDLRDIKIEEWRRQIKALTTRLALIGTQG